MIRAVKKFKKLWPRKKKRKRSYQEPYYYLPPPPLLPPAPPPLLSPPCHYCCSYSTPVQPSAPPLPSWLEPEQTHEANSSGEVQQLPEMGYQGQNTQFPSQEIVVESNDISPLTYQQYMVPNRVYGLPVVEQTPPRRIERYSGGFFACFAKFGASLIRCFCPCFHIREVD